MSPVQESNRRQPRLTQRDEAHLKLLDSLVHGSGGELGVIRQIAAWIDSPVVLSRICRHPAWYDHWDIKEALVRNDYTPNRIRADLEAKVAIFDLLRELDNPSLQPREKVEIRDNIKHLTETLSDHDREVVKKRAYDLSASRRGKTGAAVTLPEPVPTTVETEDEFRLDFEPVADETEHQAEVSPPVAESAPDAETLEREQGEAEPEADAGIAAEAVGPAEDETAPQEFGSVDQALAQFDLNWEVDTLPNEVEPDLPEDSETETDLAEPDAEAPVAETGPDFTWGHTGQPPSAEAPPPAEPVQETVVPEPEPEPQQGLPAEILAAPEPADELALARESSDPEVLGRLVNGREELQIALLQNPALDERLATLLARKAGGRVAAEIYRQRNLFMRPAVRLAFLETPHAPSAALLEIVGTLGDAGGLLKVIRNPKIRFMEVKAKARARLATVFKSMGTGEKLAAIRRSGRFLLKELWTDFFRDEALVLQCLREKSLDQGIVLEISRSRIAPRYALELITKNGAWISNQNICMSLVQNPKTPRDAVPKLIQKLSPANRRLVRNNLRLPSDLRRYA